MLDQLAANLFDIHEDEEHLTESRPGTVRECIAKAVIQQRVRALSIVLYSECMTDNEPVGLDRSTAFAALVYVSMEIYV